jgi:hypothetical protein
MKKNLLFTAAMLFAVHLAVAQTQKGSQTLGGNASFTRSTTSTEGNIGTSATYTRTTVSTNFNIGPSYGYFVADGLELGGNFTFANGTDKAENIYSSTFTSATGKNTANTYGAGIFIRKYFVHASKLGVRVGPYAGYSFTKANSSNITGGFTTEGYGNAKTFNAGALLDLVYFPSKKLGIAANLAGITYNRSNNNGGNGKSSTDGFKANLANQGLTLCVWD